MKIIYCDTSDYHLTQSRVDPNIDSNYVRIIYAGTGYTNNKNIIFRLLSLSDANLITILTNDLSILDNDACFDSQTKKPIVYIMDPISFDMTYIQELTKKELRPAHNLRKMYIAGSFGKWGK